MRKSLGNPKSLKLLNGWHPLMEKKNMMILTEEWREKPSNTQAKAKNSPNSQQQQFQLEEAFKNSEKREGKSTSHKPIPPSLHNPKDSEGCHGKFVSDGQSYDRITEKGGHQIRISEMISNILDGVPNFHIPINDVKSHISQKNSSICKALKTNNLIVSQINETLMCFERV
ncbi:hypothetical protein O181_081735 [Austropuccinia psidii MF-1]|uniref:Uncharacterized protein n=1 Tax=Austropuccinia psidii MF-1 TaxID=1389203 RepID=A0A9Q3IK64_9BASI|nr:hypothetical protein [Austropuccinia psidii MF-1]